MLVNTPVTFQVCPQHTGTALVSHVCHTSNLDDKRPCLMGLVVKHLN